MIIDNCWVSKVLVNGGSSVNILYGSALDKMEDTPETARAMINPQTQSYMYEFDGNETHSPGTVALPVRADPYNVITEFYLIDMESPHNVILVRPWLHTIKAMPSSTINWCDTLLRLG